MPKPISLCGSIVSAGSGQQENIITLAAGSYNYTCVYNTSENYTSSKEEDYFVINKVNSSTNIFLNGSSSDITVERAWVVNISANVSNTQGTIHLYNNSVLITSCGGTNTCENIETHPADVDTEFNITAEYNETQNYTGTSKTWYIIINNTIPTVPTLLYPIDNDYTADNTTTFDWSDSNDVNSEQSITYDFRIFYENGSLKQENTSLSPSTITLSVSELLPDGKYNWTVRAYHGADYSDWASNFTLTVDTILPDITFYNPSPLNTTIVNQSIGLNISSRI
jgi:hypothetical protein